MIQSISFRANLVAGLDSSKSSLGACETTMKKIIHLCLTDLRANHQNMHFNLILFVSVMGDS